MSVQEDASNSLDPYIISRFSSLSISPAISQASYIFSGAIDIPLARAIEFWGLDVGFSVAVVLNTLGPAIVSCLENTVGMPLVTNS